MSSFDFNLSINWFLMRHKRRNIMMDDILQKNKWKDQSDVSGSLDTRLTVQLKCLLLLELKKITSHPEFIKGKRLPGLPGKKMHEDTWKEIQDHWPKAEVVWQYKNLQENTKILLTNYWNQTVNKKKQFESEKRNMMNDKLQEYIWKGQSMNRWR